MTPRLLHQTDLFRPFIDPDDHWDLACVYALAAAGKLDLGGVLLDYPPDHHPGRSPDITGVAQLSYLAGLPVNAAVGASAPYIADRATLLALPARERAGAQFVLDYLRGSEAPAYISIVGSCRDVAMAATMAPELFEEKCAGIYLNAGTGNPDPAKQGRTEYNVLLNAAAYGAIFNAPCPLYWMPCFETLGDDRLMRKVERFGTYYSFNQREILPQLPPSLQRYFAYSLEARTDARYLQSLEQEGWDVASPYTVHAERNMWCTAGFFHVVGEAVNGAGDILPLPKAGSDAVCHFRPVNITCTAEGVTSWTDAPGKTRQYVFEVLDQDRYAAAMTTAMRTLLQGFA